eukprot:s223_g9.t1
MGTGFRLWRGLAGESGKDCRANKAYMAGTPAARSQKELGRTLRGADDSGKDGGYRRTTMAGTADHSGGLARVQERTARTTRTADGSDMTANDSDGGWRTTLAMDSEDSGEDVAAIVTHHSDVLWPSPTLQRLFG